MGRTREQLAQELRELCVRGEYVARRDTAPLGGVMFRHEDRTQQAIVDRGVLGEVARVYASTLQRRAFSAHGVTAHLLEDAAVLVQGLIGRGLIWGFSGYATPGRPYDVEARGMTALLGSLRHTKRQPVLIGDGGVSQGVLGISGVLAERFGIPSLGFAPLQGLASIGRRDHLVVKMHTYEQREVLVGLLPDVLVCVGGKLGTQHECEAAAAAGSVILLLRLREYDADSFARTYASLESLQPAIAEGRVIVCERMQDIQACAADAARLAGRLRVSARRLRLQKLAVHLAA